MTSRDERHTRDLAQQLAEADATIAALLSGQIDAVVDARSGTPVLLANALTALRESEARFREQAALLDIAHDAIYVRDLDGHITYWNNGAEHAYGWTADEAVGRRVRLRAHERPDAGDGRFRVHGHYSQQRAGDSCAPPRHRDDGACDERR